jgi:hypothetical protein
MHALTAPFAALALLTAAAGMPSTPAAAAQVPTTRTQETVGPMTVGMPAEWRREARPDNTVAFLPEGAGEVQFSSFDMPGVEQDAVHETLWREMQRQLDVPTHQQSGRLGRFTWSEMEAFDPTENRRFGYRLFTTKEGPTHLVVLVVAPVQALRERVAMMEMALSDAHFAATPQGTVQAPEDVPIVESWIHLDIRPISLGSNVTTDHVLFFENGVAVRMGFIDGPRECYAALPVANLQPLPFNYGRWRADAAAHTLDVEWQEGPSWHLVREGDGLSLEGKRLTRFRAVDGAKFDGVYVHRPIGGEPTVLNLTAGGKFEALNLADSMICQTGQPPPRNGSGSYEVRHWTLVLRFANGATAMLPLAIPDEESLDRVIAFAVMSYEFQSMR